MLVYTRCVCVSCFRLPRFLLVNLTQNGDTTQQSSSPGSLHNLLRNRAPSQHPGSLHFHQEGATKSNTRGYPAAQSHRLRPGLPGVPAFPNEGGRGRHEMEHAILPLPFIGLHLLHWHL